jgi:hypothetical protein
MDYICKVENVEKYERKGLIRCTDKDKIAALNKHSRQAVEQGKMALMTPQPRPAPPKPKVKK